MNRFVQSLVAVVETNQRFLLKRALLQLLFSSMAGVGLAQLSGALWWLSLALFVVFLLAAVLGAFQLKLHLTMKLEPPWRAVGLGPLVSRGKERVLELHAMQGGVQLLSVRADLVADLLSAAGADGIEVITDPAGLEALKVTSERLERLHDLEELIPHVPTPELRADIAAALAQVRARQLPGCDELLRQLEIQLMAEKSAQTTTSLRGPKPVYESEIRAQLESLSRLINPPPDPLPKREGDG